jgi:hypothetical protein
MKKQIWLILALAAALGFAATPLLARGGGHGGGHHGGGHHGAHHAAHHGAHHAGHHADHHAHHSHYHHSHWAHDNRPFSRGWYGRRGGAWGYGWGGWGWGNPWAVTTLGATAAWLGAEEFAGGWGAYAEPANVYTSDDDTPDDEAAGEEPPTEESAENETDAQATEPTPADIAARSAEAAKLATSGQNDPPKETAFLPLGVFTLAPRGQAEASALVQLAIAKDGAVRGTYYDLLSDHDHPLRGAVDKKTGRVAFTFGPRGKVVFETTLASLTQDKGSLGVHYENGKQSVWTLARYEKEPQDDEAAKQDAPSQDAEKQDAKAPGIGAQLIPDAAAPAAQP